MTKATRPAWLWSAGLVICGAVAATGLAPLGLWPLTLAGLAFAAYELAKGQSQRQAFLIGWLFGTGYFGAGLSWIVEPFLVDPERHAWMAPFALVFLATGLALFWGAAFWAAYRLTVQPSMRAAALIVLWPLAEMVRSAIFTGFPWGAPDQIWANTGVAQLLAWTGPHGLMTLTAFAAVLPVLVFRSSDRLVLRGVAFVPVVGLAVMTYALLPDPPETTGTAVRLVQPNAPQHQKWDPEMMPVFFARQIGFSAADPQPDVIIWPETAVPALLNSAGSALSAMSGAADGVPIVFGIQRYEGSRIFNSLAVLDGQGAISGVYDKHHLVPFGEYIPFGDLASRFGLRGFAAQEGDGYSSGPGPQLVDVPGLGRALPLICYEAVFPRDVSDAPARPDILLQITNDAWFGTWSGPYQHLAQARMRAIEQGLPMVRVANTGVSAMIGPRGQITAALPLGEAGYLDAEVPAPLPPTVYARTGNWPVLILLGAAFLLLIVRKWREQTTIGH